jgi:membrane associated rhomboid family serine protease
MLIPLRHEQMSARRWPVVTFCLLALNCAVFFGTHWTMLDQGPALGKVKAHILILAASHPELTVPPEVEPLVDGFKQRNPKTWTQLADQNRQLIDAWDARLRLMTEAEPLQAEMNSLAEDYKKLTAESVAERYAFIPAHPKPLTYLTANFLHGGWLHLIGNMWFLWLAGFVLEDVWGRAIYSVFYLLAGAAALQFYAWTNAGSFTPTLGASGAVAALMGAFLVRFPKMKIDMAWLFGFRLYRFKAPAVYLLPLWLAMEVFYGTLLGSTSGVAHWAHVGGFLFGAIVAVGLRYSGLEHKATAAVDEQMTWKTDPEIEQATEMFEKGELDSALNVLQQHLAAKPDSVDAWSLLAQIYWRKNELPAHREAVLKMCELHLKARESEAALQDYQDFVNAGGTEIPAPVWLDLCRAVEQQQNFDRALTEYEKLAAAHPADREGLLAKLGAAKVCMTRFNRPQDALRLYEEAAASPVPHLDWEQNIQSGIREAKALLAAPAMAGSD